MGTERGMVECRCNCHEDWWVEEGNATHKDCELCLDGLLEEENLLGKLEGRIEAEDLPEGK